MDKTLIERLVKKLGMSTEMSVVLDSEESYTRFEEAISSCLNSHRGWINPFVVYTDVVDVFDGRGKRLFKRHHSMDYLKARRLFESYYGIGQESLNSGEIAKKEEISPNMVLNYVHYISKILRQKHRKDLWYGTL